MLKKDGLREMCIKQGYFWVLYAAININNRAANISPLFPVDYFRYMKEYEVGPGDSAEVDVADEDVVYIDAVY